MAEEINLRTRVAVLEAALTVLTARVATLENKHIFGVEQMNRIEGVQSKILDEVAKIMPTQDKIDELTAKLESTAVKLEAAAK